MGLSVQGSRRIKLADRFGVWQLVAKQVIDSPSAPTAIPATTTSTIASPGVIITFGLNEAVRIRRYVAGVSSVANPNQFLVFASSLEVQQPPFGIGAAQISNDTWMLTATPAAAAANAQTLSDMSDTVMLRDDWFEFDDYQGLSGYVGAGLSNGGIKLQGFWRIRNTSAGALSVDSKDTVFFERYQKTYAFSKGDP